MARYHQGGCECAKLAGGRSASCEHRSRKMEHSVSRHNGVSLAARWIQDVIETATMVRMVEAHRMWFDFVPGTKGECETTFWSEEVIQTSCIALAAQCTRSCWSKGTARPFVSCREAATVEHACGARHERRMRSPCFYTTRFGLPAELTEPHVLGVPLMRGLDGRDEQL